MQKQLQLRMTNKFLLSQLLHMKYDMSVYQSTGECIFLVWNLISQYHFLFVFIHYCISWKQRNYEQ